MDDTNGIPKAPRVSNGIKINGTNGNGSIKLPLNGHAVGPKRVARRRPGMLASTLNIVARLLTWYSIITILFRCPSSLDACDENAPRICKPYFQLKHAVTPHVEPYYDTYAAPYVDLVRPYYDTVDRTYGGPRVLQAQAFSKAQWEKSVQPQVEKYQGLARARYDEKLAPHIDRVSTSFAPYYEIARTNTLQAYHGMLLPTYHYVQPHLHHGYQATSAFTSSTVVPVFVWTWNKTYTFLDDTLGPQIRAVYVENVEPQLTKIGKRLGRYSTGKKSVPKPVTGSSSSVSSETNSSFTRPAASASATSASSVAPPSTQKTTADSARARATMEHIPPPEVDEKLEKEDPVRRSAREIVAADLKDWQERYAKAADEGAAEIDERIQEIAKKMIRRNARTTGKSLLEQLQNTSVAELISLRRAILEAIASVKNDAATFEDGQEQIQKAVRQAGLAVKKKAQGVRTWREKYDAEVQFAITQAAETHFTILENIRDLALQKIGMKWAWMDGVTYKDWAKYHLLKSRFDEWKGDLENHVVTHPSIEAAQVEAATIEEEAMKVAATTASELARLKQVAHWKLLAGDDTAEFDSTLMQQAAEAVESARQAAANAAAAAGESVKQAKDSVVDGVGEGVDAASNAMNGGASAASEAVGKATDAAADAVSQASGAILGTLSTPTQSETSDPSSEPVVEASLALEDSQISPSDASVIIDPEVVSVSVASEEIFSVVEPTSQPTPEAENETPVVASSMMFETPVMVGNYTEVVDEDNVKPVELPVEDEGYESGDNEGLPVSDTAKVKPALFGAAAQSVPKRRGPILDEDTLDDVSSAMESLRKDVTKAYSSAMARANDQYSQALSIVSAQIRGTPQPAHKQLLASVTSAYSKAMATASARMDDALKVASGQIYGTTTTNKILPAALPTPTVPEWSEIELIATSRLQQGRAWAAEQYESARIAIGLATPTPSTAPEHVQKMLDNAMHNYYAGVGLAHARYSEFMSAASSALSSMTATPTPTDIAGSASSMAFVASESAASAAAAASEGVSSAAAAAGDAIADSWDVVVTKISLQVYGQPTPTAWYASVYSAVNDYAASATSAAGEYASSASSAAGDYVSSASFFAGDYASSAGSGAASVTSAAGSYAAAGTDEIARQYSAVSSIMSEVLIGKEPTFSESVISRLSAAYATGIESASSAAEAAQVTAAAAANQAGERVKSAGEKVASVASEATEVVKEKVEAIRDEL
ncbi:hypothetical protein N0V88_006841 [Collariella sp. IMI 366227]|nr:hypothetical protein N0V88_006841 [Collariella sp. IMI 366227]